MRRSIGPRLFICLVVVAAKFTALVRADEVDDCVEAERVRQRIPGVAILVTRGGEIVKAKGYGLANVEHEVPVTDQTVFQSGSMGKQFTATAVMMLVDDGKLGLDDPIRKHLTDAPDSWDAITVRHLLSHTAGLGDYPPLLDLQRDISEEPLMEVIYKTKLKFTPGDDWQYSNLGYATLGALIRKVSGEFYGDYLKRRVFEPLGMISARIISEADIVPHRAAGYRLVKGELKNQQWVAPGLNTTADGSLYLTVQDLARWDSALRGETLVKKATLERMWTPAKLNSGEPNKAGYGFGWMCKLDEGNKAVLHGGAWQGFTTFIIRYLDDDLTVAVLTNLSAESANPGKIAQQIADVYLPQHAASKSDAK